MKEKTGTAQQIDKEERKMRAEGENRESVEDKDVFICCCCDEHKQQSPLKMVQRCPGY